jgi:hypothetical protein
MDFRSTEREEAFRQEVLNFFDTEFPQEFLRELEAGSWRSEVLCRNLYGVVDFSPLRGKDEFLQAMDLMRAR